MGDGGKRRLHIKNNRAGEEIFRVTPERLEAALARHPEVARRIEVFVDWDLDSFDRSMATAAGMVTWDLPTEDLARRAPELKWIHIIGAGVEHLAPCDWLPPGVTLTNNSGVHAAKFQDYATMALLMLNAGLPRLTTAQRARRWEPIFSSPIAGKMLTIVGVGRMGGVVARAAKDLGLTVFGVRRGGRPARYIDRMFGPEDLCLALGRADFVFVATPLTPETQGLIGAREFAAMKEGAGIVNVGRAPVVDYAALAEALRRGRLSNAILDVFEPEPLPPTSPLWQVPGLLVTPNVAADDLDDYMPLTLDLVMENMARLLAGRPLKNKVRPRLGY